MDLYLLSVVYFWLFSIFEDNLANSSVVHIIVPKPCIRVNNKTTNRIKKLNINVVSQAVSAQCFAGIKGMLEIQNVIYFFQIIWLHFCFIYVLMLFFIKLIGLIILL